MGCQRPLKSKYKNSSCSFLAHSVTSGIDSEPFILRVWCPTLFPCTASPCRCNHSSCHIISRDRQEFHKPISRFGVQWNEQVSLNWACLLCYCFNGLPITWRLWKKTLACSERVLLNQPDLSVLLVYGSFGTLLLCIDMHWKRLRTYEGARGTCIGGIETVLLWSGPNFPVLCLSKAFFPLIFSPCTIHSIWVFLDVLFLRTPHLAWRQNKAIRGVTCLFSGWAWHCRLHYECTFLWV